MRCRGRSCGTAGRSCRGRRPLGARSRSPSSRRLRNSLPDPLVGPVVDVFRRVALEVHALHGLGALADQGEAVLGVGVDQLVQRCGGASARMPNQANGYSRKYRVRLASGIWTAADGCGSRRRRPGSRPRISWLPAVRVGEPDLAALPRGRGRSVSLTLNRTSPPSRLAARGEIDEDVGLRVQPHGLAHELLEVDAVALAAEAQDRCPRAGSPSRSTRSETPESTSMLTVPCSRMPARSVSSISRRLRISHDRGLDALRRPAGGRA